MEEGIIQDIDIFREDYLPSHILCREAEIKELVSFLKPASYGRKPKNVMLFGKPGTGKTTLAKYALSKLKSEAGLSGAYVDIWENKTQYSVLEKLVQEEKIFFAEAREVRCKLAKFREHIEGSPYLVVLDDIDMTSPKEREDILKSLIETDKVGVICTSQDANRLLLSFDRRIRSRFMASKIEIKPYEKKDLFKILKQRAELALYPNSFDENTLKIIANMAEGDCRVAVQTLRVAGEIAEKDAKRIECEHVKKAFKTTSKLRRRYYLYKLTEHHRIIYRIIESKEGIISPALWENYLKICRKKGIKSIARRTFTKYIRRLKNISMIESKRASVRGRVRKFFVKKEG